MYSIIKLVLLAVKYKKICDLAVFLLVGFVCFISAIFNKL